MSRVGYTDARGVVQPALSCTINQPRTLATIDFDVSGATPHGGDDIVTGEGTVHGLAHAFRVARRRCSSAPSATRVTVAMKKRVANALTCGGIPFCTLR